MKQRVCDSRIWITKFNNTTGRINTYYAGMARGEIWGFRVAGLFERKEDIMPSADHSWFTGIADNGGTFLPGDLKFKDLNGDDVIDKGTQTLDNTGDLTIIGNTTPRYQYGINLGANWAGFGISVFLQGVGKKDWYPARESA